MGIYVTVRGWLEIDDGLRKEAERIINADPDDIYSHGWFWPARQVNWSTFLFYGADVREGLLDKVWETVAQLAELSTESGSHPMGLFLISNERGKTLSWEVRDGVVDEKRTPHYDWMAQGWVGR